MNVNYLYELAAVGCEPGSLRDRNLRVRKGIYVLQQSCDSASFDFTYLTYPLARRKLFRESAASSLLPPFSVLWCSPGPLTSATHFQGVHR